MQLITRVWYKILKIWWQFTVPMRLRAQGVELGSNCHFYGMPILGVTEGSSIIIGDRVTLCSDSRFTALGVNHPVIIRTLRSGARIVIGSDCGISGGSICSAISVELGNEVLLGANVTIADTDFHSINPKNRRHNPNVKEVQVNPVRVDDNVFIGTGAVVLKGVYIGKNSVVGAMSLVSKNIPTNEIWAGVPAVLVRNIN
jgi:acetyltransferase-like isoleucine patch superfamily enzyme